MIKELTKESTEESTGESPYPVHEHLALVRAELQAAGDFLEKLELLGLHLCEFVRYPGTELGEFVRTSRTREQVLALAFDVDLPGLEAEKVRMLEAQRARNEPASR